MRRACRSCAGAEVQTVGPSVGQDFVDRVRSTGQLPEMYSDPTRAQVHLLATFFRGHRTYPGTPNGSSGSEARRLGHGLKPPHRDPRTPSTPASCRSNTADQLRSGAPVRLARGGTGRHLSVPYGCRPVLRQLHPLVGRPRSPMEFTLARFCRGRLIVGQVERRSRRRGAQIGGLNGRRGAAARPCTRDGR
jgi:hypothetical protein